MAVFDRRRWKRIEALFAAASGLPADERSSFLVTECDGDAALRQEVESLLDAAERDGAFIEDAIQELLRSALRSPWRGAAKSEDSEAQPDVPEPPVDSSD